LQTLGLPKRGKWKVDRGKRTEERQYVIPAAGIYGVNSSRNPEIRSRIYWMKDCA